jgi:UDP-N-acetylmuramate dehydrogenase
MIAGSASATRIDAHHARPYRREMLISAFLPMIAAMPQPRGRLTEQADLAPFTWFRVGGPAEMFFQPADEEDLAAFLAALPPEVPVTVIGLGSNLIIRDGGIPGVTIRLGGKAFGGIDVLDDQRLRAGTAAPDVKVARAAADAGIANLAFFRGIPGSIGGALKMNAGAHGGETTDVLIEARGIDRKGVRHMFSHADMGFSYRHSAFADDVIMTSALFQGIEGNPAAIIAEMDRITAAREASQPIKEKTGGSTFANPYDKDGSKLSAWKVIDAAGCRGLRMGGAQVSEMHCNFLINTGDATAADIENLGEEVRRRVKDNSGIELRWEIKRIGIHAPAT